MTAVDVTNMVSALGFPIVACFFLWKSNREMTKEHKEETSRFTDALQKNTLVLQKLCDKMGVEREDDIE